MMIELKLGVFNVCLYLLNTLSAGCIHFSSGGGAIKLALESCMAKLLSTLVLSCELVYGYQQLDVMFIFIMKM